MLSRTVSVVVCSSALCAVASGCSSGGPAQSTAFQGICLGAERLFYDSSQYGDPCRAYFNTQTMCAKVDGCQWTASVFCQGTPKPCEEYPESQCDQALGCSWYPPSKCSDRASCAQMMLVDDGGCTYVNLDDGYVAGCMVAGVYVDYGNLCQGAAPYAKPYTCN